MVRSPLPFNFVGVQNLGYHPFFIGRVSKRWLLGGLENLRRRAAFSSSFKSLAIMTAQLVVAFQNILKMVWQFLELTSGVVVFTVQKLLLEAGCPLRVMISWIHLQMKLGSSSRARKRISVYLKFGQIKCDGSLPTRRVISILKHLSKLWTGFKKKHRPRIKGTRGSGSKSTTTKSAGNWNFPTIRRTSLAYAWFSD
ncbi:hypothetical protein Tco_0735547 [Tanacetum coccineum]